MTFILRTKGLRNATPNLQIVADCLDNFHTQNKGIKECNSFGLPLLPATISAFILRTKGLRNATTELEIAYFKVRGFHTQNKGIKECNWESSRQLKAVQHFHTQNKGIKECNYI